MAWKEEKPSLYGPIAASIVAFFALIALGFLGGQNSLSLLEKWSFYTMIAILNCISVIRWVLYLKQYVDYRFQEIERADLE